MTERVAAAAYAEFSDNDPTAEFAWWYGKDEGEPYDWRREADSTSVGTAGFLRCARAAIAAMREPTEAMRGAGKLEMIYAEAGPSHLALADDCAAPVWRAMIDAALKA
jgi:hypothetical protein